MLQWRPGRDPVSTVLMAIKVSPIYVNLVSCRIELTELTPLPHVGEIVVPSAVIAHVFAQKGFHMLSVSSDVGAIGTHMSESLRKAKGETGDHTEVSTGPYGQ